MNFTPIHNGTVLIDKHDLLLDKNRFLIGIDHGRSLTKIVFLNKKNKNELIDESLTKLHLDYGIYEVNDFPKVLSWLKDQVYIQENVDSLMIPCTGTGCSKYKELIESVFGIEVKLITNDVSLSGLKFGLDHIEIDVLKAPKVEVVLPNMKIESKMMERIVESAKVKMAGCDESDETYPCLVVDAGSRSKLIWFDEDGNGQILNSTCWGGEIFLGLAKCLTDLNNYNEAVKLAASGTRFSADTQVKDAISEDPNSPYGKFPPELPLFGFGKCADRNIGLDELSKNDVMSSLVSLMAANIMSTVRCFAIITKTKKTYFTGNFFTSDLFHMEMLKMTALNPSMINLSFLKFGYCGALGALINNRC